MMRTPLRTEMAATVGTVLMVLSGCGFSGAQDLPLPGGADLGSHPYQVTAQFTDVLDLVPQADVKVNDVPVGRVAQLRLADDEQTAEAVLTINGDVRLGSDATAQLRQSSLLGEKYVELGGPGAPGGARLADGARIPVQRTDRSPEVEEVLGALSMLLNGGGVEQIHTITRELNTALSGRESDVRQFFTTLEATTRRLDAQKGDVVHAIDGLDRLSRSLAEQRGDIATAVEHLGPGLATLDQQREQLVGMLRSLDRLSAVSVDTIHRSGADLVADLHALNPTLNQLAAAGDALPKSLEVLFTFPFTDDYSMVRGDFANADVTLDLDLGHVIDNLTSADPEPASTASAPVLPLSPRPGGVR